MNGSRLFELMSRKAREYLWGFGLNHNFKSSSRKGEYGEWLARKHLIRKGYVLLENNWRSRKNQKLEIDLIFKDGNILVFVEVRARSSKSLVSGYESINRKKLNSLHRAFTAYLRENGHIFEHYRFDVVEVDLPTSKSEDPELFHHENIAIF